MDDGGASKQADRANAMKVFKIEEVEDLRDRFPGWRSYMATAIEPDVTTTVHFYQPNLALAQAYLWSLYPGCSFASRRAA